MRKNLDGIQDLQIFLSRASGDAPTFGGRWPTILVTGTARDAAGSPAAMRMRSDAPDEFPEYVAVANSEAVETVRLPFTPAFLMRFLGQLAREDVSLADCITFGAVLFDAVFHRTIRDQLRSLTTKGSILRLTIATSAPELLILPWEFLCDTQFGVLPRFLCQRQEIHLCRSLRLFNRADFELASLSNETLRILLVTASPHPLPPLDYPREQDMLKFVLDEPPAIQGADLHVLHDATVSELRKKLETIEPHIVHVACHGSFDRREGLGYLMFCSDQDRSRPDQVNAFRFASLLCEPDSVRFAFLNTCYGAAQDPESTFSGVAECLHANGIPAVAALLYQLDDRTGHAIALNLYRSLLRNRLSIEESITRVRQYLFLNNHMFSECFGLVLFQNNSSMAWNRDTVSGDVGRTSAQSDTDFVKAFEEALRQRTYQKLSTELDKITAKFADLTSLTTADLALMLHIFGEVDIALNVLRDIKQSGISSTPFLKMAKLALVLCQVTHEHEHLTTAILIHAPEELDAYLEAHASEISEKLEHGFFWGEIGKVVGEAIKVNGIDRVFAALISTDASDVTHEHIRKLKKADEAAHGAKGLLAEPRWTPILAATVGHGCALIIPDRSRVKVIAGGEQIAEYRHGKWTYANYTELRRKILALASDSDIDTGVLMDVTQKAVVSSEIGKGRTFVVRQRNGAEPRLVPGYKNVLEMDDGSELKGKHIMDFGPTEYLKLIEGDGAAVISSDGMTLAINAKLAPAPDTQVDQIVSTGTRHMSAQKITKESGSVAIVVSDDGPVTIYFQGRVVFRKL